MLSLTFIGHQSWAIEADDTLILLDPVLLSTFGHAEWIAFPVYPKRTVMLDRISRPAAVLLSHEHLDHFHLPSLNTIDRDVPILVGPLMPDCVVHSIQTLGFDVQRMRHNVPIEIGRIVVEAFGAGFGTVFWEQRVTQFHFHNTTDPRASAYIAVDAAVNDGYVQSIALGTRPSPRAVVLSNNSQIAPRGALSARSNLFDVPAPRGRFPGLQLLHGLLVTGAAGFGPSTAVVLCGNGFATERFGPFLFSDNRLLATQARAMTEADVEVFGPWPGERLDVTSARVESHSADWIQCDHAATERLRELNVRHDRHAAFLPLAPMPIKLPEPRIERTLADELAMLARHMMSSPMCRLALNVDEHLSGPLGSRRIALRLFNGDDVRAFCLDVNRAAFIAMPVTECNPQCMPFGIDLYLSDFLGLFDGSLQVWDVIGAASRAWFMGDIYHNWQTALFEIYGEQVRPDLAGKVYGRAIDRLRRVTDAVP